MVETYRIDGDLISQYADEVIKRPLLPGDIMTQYMLIDPYIMYRLSALFG
jgi:hypothetical protein